MKLNYFLFIVVFLCLVSMLTFVSAGEKSILSKTNPDMTDQRLTKEIENVKKSIEKNPSYNDKLAFFVDMKIHSGKNRFFVVDLKTGNILDEGLVAHGSGSETNKKDELYFSNIENSLCTSLGVYKIGYSYVGKFGKAYKLYGLDKTNSNAFNRNIVLHKYDEVPYNEQRENICNSYGCPMVNEKFFGRLESLIDNSKKDILLNIYY